ncbi:MAG: Nitrogen regulation protein NtrB [Rhodanobacteraceae bacterium]|jgi:two-component system nitrogen regulation sensor histidine kinase GlnL|nr:MAG: Nitrogen regulation protein NtrB [Rhodanobacteraceae bacterium]
MPRTKLDTSAIDQLATGVAWLDARGRLAHANPAFAEHTGYGLTRLLGQTLAALRPEGERLHAIAQRSQAEQVALASSGVTVCAAPGHDVRLDFSFTPSDGGAWVEIHRTAAAGDAARVSESLRGFAHEIRNPLAAISGAAQLLEQRADDSRQRELAQLIREESARLGALAERLLGARIAMATRAANVHAVLERAAELLHAERADVAVVRDYDPSLPAWQGDPDRLLQAVLNLVRNAVEANAARVILRSRAEAGWRDSQGQRVPALRIEVEDNGDGVPHAIAATLFEPMVSGRPDGTGLGLALAREIAREHGGELTWRSLDAGSCFVLLLPRHPRTGGQDG